MIEFSDIGMSDIPTLGFLNTVDFPVATASKTIDPINKFDEFMPDEPGSEEKEPVVPSHDHVHPDPYYIWDNVKAEHVATSLVFILISIIGDKTFIYLMICTGQMNFCKLLILGSISLLLVHAVSVGIGYFLQMLVPLFWIQVVSIVIFLV